MLKFVILTRIKIHNGHCITIYENISIFVSQFHKEHS